MDKQCKFCGATENLIEIRGYDWDRNDEDALSIQQVIGYQCRNGTECAQRVVEQGTSVEGLREVVRIGYEHLDRELVDRAREILQGWATIARAEAETADLVARESGYGAIGHG